MSRAVHATVALALTVGSSGCFTTWATLQIGGNPRLLDERVRQEVVPLPGVEEALDIQLPLRRAYPPPPAPPPPAVDPATGQPVAAAPAPAPAALPLPLALGCSVSQRARDAVYRQAFRYDRTWKLATTAAFALEALGALVITLTAKDQLSLIQGAALGVDALGTGILRFLPRKEIYRKDEVEVTTPLRSDCPEGMTLEIGGESYPVDAAGQVGAFAEEALDAWMQAPVGGLRVRLRDWTAELPVGDLDRCAWNSDRGSGAACGSVMDAPRGAVHARIVVPVGALSGL